MKSATALLVPIVSWPLLGSCQKPEPDAPPTVAEVPAITLEEDAVREDELEVERPDSDSVLEPGQAKMQGVVDGRELARLNRAFIAEPSPGIRVVLVTRRQSCDYDESAHLVLYACRAPGETELRRGEPDCEQYPQSGFVLLEEDTDYGSASQGTLTIRTATPEEMSGTVSGEIAGFAFQGEFRAIPCEPSTGEDEP